ncbi:MAG TPA: M2 family metallopeptidase [Longimicrobiales bacterium]|nr:M2 family metallopeptidase [Longimicrobiales bacterium]
MTASAAALAPRLALVTSLLLAACTTTTPAPAPAPAVEPAPAPAPEQFVADAEHRLATLSERASRAQWVQANFITDDTELLASQALEAYVETRTAAAVGAARYADDASLAPDVARGLLLLRVGMSMPAPSDSAKRAEVTRLSTSLDAAYGRGKWCPANAPRPALTGGEAEEENPWADGCLDIGEMTEILATSRDEGELRAVWEGWRTISPPMRDDYRRFVELMNEGARELGFDDTGALWRSGYDMTPAELEAEVNRLWQQVKPLYDELHCYVRAELSDFYGADVVPLDGPMPAHLLGNMWAQDWANVFDVVAPGDVDRGYDLTAQLQAQDYDALRMVRTAEGFFTSMGFEPLPGTFWERSLFTQPRDRDVVCHASAWNIDDVEDLRIKMCITPTAEDFQTIHHELGHSFYQRAYNQQPWLFRGGAHDGFHEAIGDAIALSTTPAYLVRIGLIEEEPPASGDIALLLQTALSKVAFLPFGLLVDQWRWDVFSGETPPSGYNRAWWELRERYQGIAPPSPRGEEFFDPGAKYHIPGNTPYTRYFLAAILQFQFHRAMCDIAGYEGPLHRCTVYDSDEAGRALDAMMELGQSRDWRDALQALTGQREMDASAIVDYYAPLMVWLRERNAGASCGW